MAENKDRIDGKAKHQFHTTGGRIDPTRKIKTKKHIKNPFSKGSDKDMTE
jgi:hypothetical protein